MKEENEKLKHLTVALGLTPTEVLCAQILLSAQGWIRSGDNFNLRTATVGDIVSLVAGAE